MNEVLGTNTTTYGQLLFHNRIFLPVSQKDKDYLGTRHSTNVPPSASPYTDWNDYLKDIAFTKVKKRYTGFYFLNFWEFR